VTTEFLALGIAFTLTLISFGAGVVLWRMYKRSLMRIRAGELDQDNVDVIEYERVGMERLQGTTTLLAALVIVFLLLLGALLSDIDAVSSIEWRIFRSLGLGAISFLIGRKFFLQATTQRFVIFSEKQRVLDRLRRKNDGNGGNEKAGE
jgi:hypothetical protein